MKNKSGFTITEVELITEAHEASKTDTSASVTHGWHKGASGNALTTFIGRRRLKAGVSLVKKGVVVHTGFTQDFTLNRNLVTDFFCLTPEWQARLDAEDAALEKPETRLGLQMHAGFYRTPEERAADNRALRANPEFYARLTVQERDALDAAIAAEKDL